MKNKKRNIILICSLIVLVLLVSIGITYAFYTYSKTGSSNSQLVAGDIYMHYKEKNQINATGMLPIDINNYHYLLNSNMTEEELSSCESLFNDEWGWDFDEDETAKAFCEGTGIASYGYTFKNYLDFNFFESYQLEELKSRNIIKQDISKIQEKIPYFEFTIDGENNYSKDIWYEVILQRGEEPTGEENKDRTERIKDDLLRFRLVEMVNGEEQEIFTNRVYESIINERIYVNTINANTREKITKTYRLYMWISDSVRIGEGDNIDYDTTTWNDKVYASVKVDVKGDFNKKEVDYYPPSQPEKCFITEEFQNNGKTEIMITDYDTDCGPDVVIPRKINGFDVTVIGKKVDNESYIMPITVMVIGAFQLKNLTSVVIPNTVRIIGSHAFSDNNLTKVEIPDSVEWIDSNAFSSNQLTRVNIPNSVETIGNAAFSYNQLINIIIGNVIKYIDFSAFDKNNNSNPSLSSITIDKPCEEIKNIEASSEDTTKYYPWLDSRPPYTYRGVTIYGSNGEVCDSY